VEFLEVPITETVADRGENLADLRTHTNLATMRTNIKLAQMAAALQPNAAKKTIYVP